jgi:hypothetical protein
MSKVQRRLYLDLEEQGTDGDEVDASREVLHPAAF